MGKKKTSIVARARSGIRRVTGYVRRDARPGGKTVSLLTVGSVAAIMFTITGWLEAERQKFYGEIQRALRSVNISWTVNGATIYMSLVALAVASALSPNFIGAKVNGILSRFHLRV